MQKFNMMVAKKYTDRNGDTKTQWVRIGSMVDNGTDENGKRKLFGNIDTTPTFEWDGSISLFEQEERNQNAPQQQQLYQQPQQNQSYQQPSQQQMPVQQEYRNAQGQLIDANGNLIQQ